MVCTYAGIGSRITPETILCEMTCIARVLAEAGFVLRSGGAVGADSAFEIGAGSDKQIFLPEGDIPEEAFPIAARLHPAWERCDEFAKRNHARNVLQVLGANLSSPVEFVICWTKYGASRGGTRTAIELAKEQDIPVFNMAKGEYSTADRVLSKLSETSFVSYRCISDTYESWKESTQPALPLENWASSSRLSGDRSISRTIRSGD